MSRLLYTYLRQLEGGLRATVELDGGACGVRVAHEASRTREAADIVMTTDFRGNRAAEQTWRA